jgi:hypothetical protein
MIALAATLVFAPEAMSSVNGALAVFGIAGAVIVIILAAEKARNRDKRSRARRGNRRRRPVRS